MPTYEYRCKKGHVFEVVQRMTDDPVATCERCSAPVERVFHPVAVHFKGSGFYNTDYGKRKRGGSGGSESGAGAADGGATSTGSKDAAKDGKGAAGDTKKPSTAPTSSD